MLELLETDNNEKILEDEPEGLDNEENRAIMED
jgi:hypothetical protein